MWYHYAAEHNARIVGTKDGARISQRILFALSASVTFAEWPTEVRISYLNVFVTSKGSHVTFGVEAINHLCIRTGHLLLRIL